MGTSLSSLWRRWRHLGVEALSEFIDGRLSPQARRRLEGHLGVCQRCRQELASLQHTVGLLQRVSAVDAPRSFALHTVPMAAPEPRAARLPNWAFGAAAASLALLLVALVSADLGGILAGDKAPVPDREAQGAPAAEAAPSPAMAAEPATMAAAAEEPGGPTAAAPTPAPAEGRERALAAPGQEDVGTEMEPPLPASVPAPSMPAAEGTVPESAETAAAPVEEVQVLPPDAADEKEAGTGALWRALEGLLGFLLLLLLGGTVWRLRRARRPGLS